jgi:molybdate/tungstate transport system ATP-binding protein
MLKIKNLFVRLGRFELREVNLEVARGEYFVLLGLSGSGKSVLLQIIGGLIRAGRGEIFLNSREISREKIQNRKVGIVFQDSMLFPHMNVFENIAYPLKSKKFKQKEIEARVAELAELTSIGHLLGRLPGNLSGGESQRAALARTLATEPECLLLDEPLSSLDVQLRGEMRTLLRKINERGQTIVHVTHDYEEAALLAHRIGVIEGGRIVQTGDYQEVFRHPRSEFVARFVGIRNFFPGVLREAGESLRLFRTAGIDFTVLSDKAPGEGFIVIRAEDVIVSTEMLSSSAVNNFRGHITDLEPARIGVEVITDIGVKMGALLSRESVVSLGLEKEKLVWLSIKASAIRYINK